MSGSPRLSDAKEDLVHVSLQEDGSYSKWQTKLLPFMTRMVALLTIFFFLASLGQLIYLHVNISKSPPLSISESFSQLPPASSLSAEQSIEASKLRALVLLEGHSLERQYHQANVLLMARVWTSYLGFVTGMVLALVGAAFILGKLREPISELSTALQATSINLKSASPGLLLAVLGTILMLATIITHHNIEVVDKAVYLRDSTGLNPGTVSAAPELSPLPKAERKEAATGTPPVLQPLTTKTERPSPTTAEPPPLRVPSPITEQSPVASPQQPVQQRPSPKPQVTP